MSTFSKVHKLLQFVSVTILHLKGLLLTRRAMQYCESRLSGLPGIVMPNGPTRLPL